jgi:UDP-galactopyranose mutase
MLTAMLTVQNLADGTSHDIWEVNVEEDYHEEVSARRSETEDVAPAVGAA